jgi:ribonuclease HIII
MIDVMKAPIQPFVATINLKLATKLLADLKEKEFAITFPLHTEFSAKKDGISCTLYTSGKLVVQGRNSQEFIEFYLEPEILQDFQNHRLLPSNPVSHIGIDESGKGDFFGPLCIAGIFAPAELFPYLKEIGVKDSKLLSDEKIRIIGPKIKQKFLHQIIKINPPKYNELYKRFLNLNRLLAWGHATAIEELVKKSGCQEVIIDQFANESVVESALKKKNLQIKLTQQHRAEVNLAVAAASILARLAFIEALDQLSQEIGVTLPKGSPRTVIAIGKQILRRHGEGALRNICKEHFKTFGEILSS